MPALISVADSDLNGSVIPVEAEEKGWKKDGAALLLHSVFPLPQAKFFCFRKELSILKQISFAIHRKTAYALFILVWCINVMRGGKLLLETEQNTTPSRKPSSELNGNQKQY